MKIEQTFGNHLFLKCNLINCTILYICLNSTCSFVIAALHHWVKYRIGGTDFANKHEATRTAWCRTLAMCVACCMLNTIIVFLAAWQMALWDLSIRWICQHMSNSNGGCNGQTFDRLRSFGADCALPWFLYWTSIILYAEECHRSGIAGVGKSEQRALLLRHRMLPARLIS